MGEREIETGRDRNRETRRDGERERVLRVSLILELGLSCEKHLRSRVRSMTLGLAVP